jgi:hypothetical protein
MSEAFYHRGLTIEFNDETQRLSSANLDHIRVCQTSE